MDLLRKILKDGAEIAAAVVEKGIEELEKAETRRQEFEKKAAKTVEKVVDAAAKGREEFESRAEKRVGEFLETVGDVLGAVLGEEPRREQAEVKPTPAKLPKPEFKAPEVKEEPVVTRPPVTVVPEESVVKAPRKAGTPKRKPSSGKKMAR